MRRSTVSFASLDSIGTMGIMRYPHISKLDLDLLYYLAVLLEERHITKAAKRCFLSQSAMSRHLDRLREALGDDLLIRNGRSHDRTARGERLLRELEPLLPRLEGILQGRGFDPASSRDRFRMAMTDNACMIFLPQLVGRMTKAAPESEIEVLPWTETCLEDLRSGRTDTVISVAGLGVHPSINSETIFTDKFVCVVSTHHPLNVKRVSLQQYLKYRHVVVAVMAGQQTLVDRPLSDLSLKRKVGLSLPFFTPAISAVADSDMILTLPRRLAVMMARSAAVRLMAAPPEVKGYRYDMMWHPRLDGDPAHSWFREQVRAVGQRITQGRLVRLPRVRNA
jgi:DNA-binding transcriptional LysR family regulator